MMINWFDTLLDYDFGVVHLPGIKNVLPDALSRLFPPEKELKGMMLTQMINRGKMMLELHVL